MNLANVPFKRVIVTGALVGALSMSALATVSAQELTATPDAPAAEATALQADPGFLGVRLADADAGVTVLLVLTDLPAAVAGLAEGDVITEVNGETVANAQAVADAIAALSAGDAVALGVTLWHGNAHCERDARPSGGLRDCHCGRRRAAAGTGIASNWAIRVISRCASAVMTKLGASSI